MEKGKAWFWKGSPASAVLWLLVVLSVVLIVLFSVFKPHKKETAATASKPVPVRILAVTSKNVPDLVTLPGRVEANVSAMLSAEKPGRVVELAVDKGDVVTKGQVLLQIDRRNWEALQRQAQVELEDAERELVRWTQMKSGGAVAASEFDAVQRRRDLASAAAEQAAVQVDQCTMTSPFDGMVDARKVERGEYVNEGQACLKVLNLSPLKILASVPERDAAVIKAGDVCRITSPSLTRAPFEGRVAFLAQEATPASFTYPLELVVEEPPAGLRPGMIVDVEINRGERENVITVPLASVIPRRGEHVVFVVEQDTAVRRVVSLETITGQEALLGSGLKAGDKLVIEGHRGLQDGVPVLIDGPAEGGE